MVTDLIAEREYLEIYARRYRTEPGLARCYRSRDNLQLLRITLKSTHWSGRSQVFPAL